MQALTHTVLCVDDEKNILNALKRLLRKEAYRLLTCTSGQEALTVLAENDVHVVISDQRMPEMNGTELFSQIKVLYPHILRIILTGYTDVDTITNSINEGHIYKFFLKPWNDQHLTLEIRQALEQYDLIQDNKRLYEMALQTNEELKAINEKLESIVEERTQVLEMQNRALQLSQAMLEDLPSPIVGVSSEMMIVFANRAAQKQFHAEQTIDFGSSIIEYFDGLSADELQQTITSLEKRQIRVQGKRSAQAYHLQLIPLTGRFSNSGVIITMLPQAG
ncbi:MAG: response regulator [Desulfobacteraceae bacterium]|nr:MAG: response regulator [Desulfobacteraceae bacterium]